VGYFYRILPELVLCERNPKSRPGTATRWRTLLACSFFLPERLPVLPLVCVCFLRLVLTRDSPVLCYLFHCADSKTWNPSRGHLSRLRPPSVPLAVCWSPVIKCDAFTASPPSTSFYRERWCPLHHRQPLLRTPPLSPLDQPTVKAGRLGTLGSCDCHRTGRT
jgi:hypothetical protein